MNTEPYKDETLENFMYACTFDPIIVAEKEGDKSWIFHGDQKFPQPQEIYVVRRESEKARVESEKTRVSEAAAFEKLKQAFEKLKQEQDAALKTPQVPLNTPQGDKLLRDHQLQKLKLENICGTDGGGREGSQREREIEIYI